MSAGDPPVLATAAGPAGETPERLVQVAGIFAHDVRLHQRRGASCGQEFVDESDLTRVAATAWSSWAIPRMVTDGTLATREPYVRVMEERTKGLKRAKARCPACGGVQWDNAVVAVW